MIHKWDSLISEKSAEIDKWISFHREKIIVPLYTSVDLRVSEHKIVPVDTNIFPSGFNNLCYVFQNKASKLFKNHISLKYPKASKVLLIPELHLKNLFYWENIFILKRILKNAGFEVRVGLVESEINDDKLEFKTSSGHLIDAYKVKKKDYKVYVEDFRPDIVLINNDFSDDCPTILKDIWQPVMPPVEIGWHTRKKSLHFYHYNKLAEELSQILGIDSWNITIKTSPISEIDFDNLQSRKLVSEQLNEFLSELSNEYENRQADSKPFAFIKSDSGTYGMAVMNVRSGEEVINFNSKERKKMRVSKGGKLVKDIVIQEGIPTTLKYQDKYSAEPVIYLVDSDPAGCFIRVNNIKDEFSNLNSRGMQFVCVSMDDKESCLNNNCEKYFLPMYKLISRVASVACGYEIQQIMDEGGCPEEKISNL